MTSQERLDIVKEILNENDLSSCTLNIKQFDELSDLELLAGAPKIVEKIKRYEQYIDTDKMKYPEKIMRDIRKYIGLGEKDASKDLEIYSMDRREVLNVICSCNGLEGYGHIIVGWIEDIFQIKLEG